MTGSGERFLIINADDFGRSRMVNEGIEEGFQRGILTSASIVATAPEFDEAAKISQRNPGLGVGIHLVLNEYDPVMPPAEIPSLVLGDGKFRPRMKQFIRMTWHVRMAEDTLREWDAQIRKVLAAGVKLDHMDGHGHCHAHPRVADALVTVGERYGLRHVRLPVEAANWKTERPSSRRFASKLMLDAFALRSKHAWGGRLQYPRAFYGFSEGGHVNDSLVRRVGELAPPGVSELMVHAAKSNEVENGYDWQGDLRAVTKFTKAAFEEKYGVKLITHTGRRS